MSMNADLLIEIITNAVFQNASENISSNAIERIADDIVSHPQVKDWIMSRPAEYMREALGRFRTGQKVMFEGVLPARVVMVYAGNVRIMTSEGTCIDVPFSKALRKIALVEDAP